MPSLNYPNTYAVGSAIVGYCSTLTYPNTSTIVYTSCQLGAIKDVTDLVAGTGTACLEVYARQDDSQHHAFGGKIQDEQSWMLLSLVNMNDSQIAEQLIYAVRDALVIPFQTHATLGDAGSVYYSAIRPKSGMFLKVFRNGQELRGHLIELVTRQEWLVTTPPGVIA